MPLKASAAAADFETLAKEAQAKGTVPVWTDPMARPVLARLTDPAMLGAPPYSAKDIPTIDPVFSKVRAAYQVYIVYLQGSKTPAEMQTRALAARTSWRASAPSYFAHRAC